MPFPHDIRYMRELCCILMIAGGEGVRSSGAVLNACAGSLVVCRSAAVRHVLSGDKFRGSEHNNML